MTTWEYCEVVHSTEDKLHGGTNTGLYTFSALFPGNSDYQQLNHSASWNSSNPKITTRNSWFWWINSLGALGWQLAWQKRDEYDDKRGKCQVTYYATMMRMKK